MTYAQGFAVISAISSSISAVFFVIGSYSDEPKQGGVFGSSQVTEYNERVDKRNARRGWARSFGFLALGITCIAAIAAAFV